MLKYEDAMNASCAPFYIQYLIFWPLLHMVQTLNHSAVNGYIKIVMQVLRCHATPNTMHFGIIVTLTPYLVRSFSFYLRKHS